MSEDELTALRFIVTTQRRKLAEADQRLKEARAANDKIHHILVHQETGRPTATDLQQ